MKRFIFLFTVVLLISVGSDVGYAPIDNQQSEYAYTIDQDYADQISVDNSALSVDFLAVEPVIESEAVVYRDVGDYQIVTNFIDNNKAPPEINKLDRRRVT